MRCRRPDRGCKHCFCIESEKINRKQAEKESHGFAIIKYVMYYVFLLYFGRGQAL